MSEPVVTIFGPEVVESTSKTTEPELAVVASERTGLKSRQSRKLNSFLFVGET